MLSRFEEAQQKWGGSHSVIDAWLTERQELLLQFCKFTLLSESGVIYIPVVMHKDISLKLRAAHVLTL